MQKPLVSNLPSRAAGGVMIWTWKMLAISTVFAALITSPLAPVIWPAVLLIISVLAGVTALILQHTPLSISDSPAAPEGETGERLDR